MFLVRVARRVWNWAKSGLNQAISIPARAMFHAPGIQGRKRGPQGDGSRATRSQPCLRGRC